MSDQKFDSIALKRLGGVESLKGEQIFYILNKIIFWTNDFYNKAAGTAKVNGGFFVESDLVEFAGMDFDLSTYADLDLAKKTGNTDANFNIEPYIFITDLINFAEQIRTSLKSNPNVKIGGQQGRDLDSLGNTFSLISISPSDNKVKAEDVLRAENFESRQLIINRIARILIILTPSIKPEEVEKAEEDLKEEGVEVAIGASVGSVVVAGVGAATAIEELGDGSNDDQNTQPPQNEDEPDPDRRRPLENDSSTPFKLSDLSPEAKLYVQSLSVITINQALQKYFPDKSITFDQLPLGVRQQLMERSFVHVHNMLLGGKQGFELSQLIKNPGSRLRFADECAIDLLLDIQGVNTLSNFLKSYQLDPSSAVVNDQKLDGQQLNNQVKNEGEENIVNSERAEEFLNQQASVHDDQFFNSLLGVISDTKNLDETLFRQFSEILGGKDLGRTKILVERNIIPTIEAFIQEGLPPSFLIAADRLDYSKFKQYFGPNLIDEKTFVNNEQQIVLLIKSYWLRKRAIWARDIRREVAQERISDEEAIKLYQEIAGDKKMLARHGKQIALLREVNRAHGGERITKIIAGQEKLQDGENTDPLLALYQEAQKESHLVFFQEFLKKEGLQGGDAGIMEVFLKFYLPAASVSQFKLTTTSTISITQVAELFSPYDLYSINANNAIGSNFEYRDGYSNQLGHFSQQNNSFGGKIAREALKWGMRGALGAATGGASEAAFLQWEAIKKADKTGISQMVEDALLNQVLEKLKKIWPILLLGLIAPFLPLLSVLGGLLLAAKNLEAIKNFLGFGKSNLASSVNQSSRIGSYSALEREALAAQQAQAAASTQAAAATTPALSPAMVVAGQAVLYTAVGSAAFVFLYYANLNSAFLTHFPFSESEIINTVEKTSKYAEMKKTAKIVKGCFATENDGSKCEKPNFPVTIEYTVVIKTKEDFAIQITDISDTIKFRQSKEAWNDNPPPIAAERVLDMNYFLPIIADLGGLSSTGLDPTSSDLINEDPLQPTADPNQQFIVLQPGQQLTFSYTLDDLNESYNHTAIINTIDVQFNYQNAVLSGSDTLKTAARVCLGDCGSGAGCWPTNGVITQLPFGGYSHSPPNAGSWFDAYDIACGSACSYKALYGPPVFARYDGNLCFKGCSDSGYGCYYILEFELEGQKYYESYAHFEEPNPQIATPNTCMQVEAGFMISLMGTRGNSSNTHLHFGLTTSYGSGFSSNPGYSTLTELVPADNGGNLPPKENQSVTTCYE